MSTPTAALTARDILDAIATKYSTAVLLPELTVADHDHDALAEQWYATGQDQGLPFPTGAVRRIDALLLEGTTQRTAIEVKTSRSDFRKETPEKRRAWEQITDRFVYACPTNLIQPEDVPPHCGLWWIAPDRSVTIKARAQRNRAVQPLPHHLIVTVANRLKRFEAAARRHTTAAPQGSFAAKRLRPTRQAAGQPAHHLATERPTPDTAGSATSRHHRPTPTPGLEISDLIQRATHWERGGTVENPKALLRQLIAALETSHAINMANRPRREQLIDDSYECG